ncbi:MAG: hypothetical protein AB8F95_10325, partial [Bacteroidia bacterium]
MRFKILFSIISLASIHFLTPLWSQVDTVYSGLIINGESLDLNPGFECYLINSTDTISVQYKNGFLLVPKLKKKEYALGVIFNSYILYFPSFAWNNFKNRIDFVINTGPFQKEDLRKIRKKKHVTYLYYY